LPALVVLSIYLQAIIFIPFYLYTFLPLYLFIFLSFYLFIFLSFHLFTFSPFHLFTLLLFLSIFWEYMSLINNHYCITLFNIANNLGMDLDNLASDIGIERNLLKNKSLWVSDQSLAQLIKTVWTHSCDEHMGLTSTPSPIGTTAFIFEHMLGADTLGEFYRRGQKACSFLPTAQGINFHVNNNNVRIEILNGYIGDFDPKRFLIEFIVVVWHRFACWATNYFIPLNAAFFSYPQPEHLFCYDGLFQCSVSFDHKATGFSFDKKSLNKPIVRSKKELANWLENAPADLLTMPGINASITNQLKVFLAHNLRTKQILPTFDISCNEICITRSIAQRRLCEEGSSYQKIKDEVRAELIIEMLENTDFTLTEVSRCSGFSETASFSRAVKKMLGMTPYQYRESLVKR
jgi:AraC-like DNA-binding protein